MLVVAHAFFVAPGSVPAHMDRVAHARAPSNILWRGVFGSRKERRILVPSHVVVVAAAVVTDVLVAVVTDVLLLPLLSQMLVGSAVV